MSSLSHFNPGTSTTSDYENVNNGPAIRKDINHLDQGDRQGITADTLVEIYEPRAGMTDLFWNMAAQTANALSGVSSYNLSQTDLDLRL